MLVTCFIVAGGTASITFISIYTRFLAENKEDEAQKTFSVIITVMTVVLSIGVILAEIFTPQIERHLFRGFTPEQLELWTQVVAGMELEANGGRRALDATAWLERAQKLKTLSFEFP